MAEMLEDRNLLVHGHLEIRRKFYHNFDSKDFSSLMIFYLTMINLDRIVY